MNPFVCTLVDPSLSAEERRAIGIGPDPLVAELVRPSKWNPWKVASRRKEVLRELERPYPLVAPLLEMQRDAIRFRDLAASQPATADAAAEAARSLAWLLWHTADRIEQITQLEQELEAAGDVSVGSAKATWAAEQRARIEELRSPIERSAAEVKALADLAEDTAYAAKLALERQPTLELAGPTGRENTPADDMESAADALVGMRSAWIDLDQRLRLLGGDATP